MGRILHFGLGSFARAHLADYTQDAGGWAITGVSLRSAAIRDGMAAQNYCYDLAVQGQGTKRITAVRDVLVAAENPNAVLQAVADPAVQIISATVTEKGYCLDAQGHLDLSNPQIASDLQGFVPQTFIGYLTRGLARRNSPVTVLSCDNLQGNGDVLARCIAQFAKAAGVVVNFAQTTFPNAMVDRITPATTDALRNMGDPMVVPTEPFREWVIEDRFAASRPNWPDVQIVSDVAPHEMRKLRMLNGAHSYLAYAGLLAGYVYVHEAIADPKLRTQAEHLMAQAAETLPPDAQAGSARYAKALLARFDNPHLAHALMQIAMDGSQKLPHRLVAPLRARGRPGAAGAGIKAWMDYCTAMQGDVDDPQAHAIRTALQNDDPLGAMLGLIGAEDLRHLIREQ
ncbi:mannitol dehydrogenase family protein [Ascidiaceihabitans sp.]|uniref:mannitol dehydrogenase family protein n=1 Tax=Ascidiaceihabitans sp. TaxID=1872644 RepID=UPI003299C5FE